MCQLITSNLSKKLKNTVFTIHNLCVGDNLNKNDLDSNLRCLLTPQGITVYQPTTTKKAMDIFAANFNDWSNASVRVITDMFRIEENGVEAKYAGEDLIRAMVFKVHCVPVTSTVSSFAICFTFFTPEGLQFSSFMFHEFP